MRKHCFVFFLPLWGMLPLSAQEPVPNTSGKGAAPLATHRSSLITHHSTRAVVIGISDYHDPEIPDLRFAHRDAEAFANFLRSPAGGSLDGDHLKVLTNEQATAGRIAEALDALVEQAKEGDQVIIYFSGHGDVERKMVSQPGFLLAWDAPSRVYMGGGTYSLAFLQEVVATLSTQNKARLMVITDACHAGKLSGSQIGGAQLTSANLAKQYANEIKILSCQPNEFSLEGEQWGGGRGCFSYHLVDGLFGLADRNEDDLVTVGELDRYLEDKVTAEAAPQSQVPMLLGNKTERLARVNAQLLADLQKFKSGQMPVFAPVEERGFEDEVLSRVLGIDSGIREQYVAFKRAVQDKRFFPVPTQSGAPENDCADVYYTRLSQHTALEPLWGFMKRNYAAALQDDAQQAMNIWLKADVLQLECLNKTLKISLIPRQLARAAELLGEGHYMYRPLQARQRLFMGISQIKHRNYDESLGRECLSLFRQSLELEPQSPLPWHWMTSVYTNNLRQPDSAFACARQARNLAPNWVLPFVNLAYDLFYQNKWELSKQAVQQAEALDSTHPYVLNYWAFWYTNQTGTENMKKALAMFDKYLQSGGATYPCWWNHLGSLYSKVGRHAEAESFFDKSLSLDSTVATTWVIIGETYLKTRRFAEAERVLLKAIALDSTYATTWNYLGYLYNHSRRYVEAEQVLQKAIALDSTYASAWGNLGHLYSQTRRYTEAERVFLKAIAQDSTATIWNNLGLLYYRTQRYAEAEQAYKKALTQDSELVPAWVNLGIMYMDTRRYAEAEQFLQKAIELDSTVSKHWESLGRVYTDIRRYAEAEQLIKKAIALDSTNSTCWNNLGYLYIRTRRFAEAEQSCKKSIALDSANIIAWNNLGFVYLNIRRYDEAEQVLKKAIVLDSTFANARRHLGMVCFKTNRPEDARQNFLKAIALNPNYAPAMLGMAYLLAAEGKTEEAFGYVEQAIGKGATFEQLEKDEDLAPLRSRDLGTEWKGVMKKHFPDQAKD
ncbi:MAG: tetratricopeptide repeat protein [Thermoanaerobaculia bacterium]|nr:tetratricopeptide repeat protein [Thermoanaerobaculia bacterium]